MKRLIFTGVAVASVLALSACGGSTSTGTTTGDSATITKISVGSIPIACDAPIHLGQKLGYFGDEGLELDLQKITGGAAAVPSVVKGDWQFAVSNLVSIMVARDKGLDLKFVTPDCSSNGSTEIDATAVVVTAGSPIKTPADLAGKTVSVNTLANIGDTTVSYSVEQDGGDPSTVKFVEIAFPDAEAALNTGQVDAAWIAEPFLTKAISAGARLVANTYVAVSPDLNIDGYFALGDTIKNKPELVKKFQNAMKKSIEYAASHPDEVRDIVGTFTTIKEDLRAKMILNGFASTFDRDAIEKLGDAAFRYGTLSKAPNLDDLLP